MVTPEGKKRDWAFLLHRLPREPSAPRIALWRALRRLGAQVLGDGLVALPASARTLEHLEWLAAGIEEQGGTASVWLAQPSSAIVGDRLADEATASIEGEYRAVLRDADRAATMDAAPRRRALRRLRRELQRIGSRDYHGAPSAADARRRVDRLAEHEVEVSA